MHFTCPAYLLSSAFSARRLSPWMSIFSVSGSAAVLDSAAFSISRRGSTKIGSSLPYQVSSSLLAMAAYLLFFLYQECKLAV